MATPRQIEANRQNAQKSTGPRTQCGKDRSRFNAVKYGNEAKSDVLPGEDPASFAERVDRLEDRSPGERPGRVATWPNGPPGSRGSLTGWGRAHVGEVVGPYSDRGRGRGPAGGGGGHSRWAHGFSGIRAVRWRFIRTYPARARRPVSRWCRGQAVRTIPTSPQRIVLRLESTAAGCHWLLARWAELGSILVREQAWQSPDKIRAIRLMGRQPLDLFDDPRVARVFLACHALDPSGGELFHEIYKELTLDEIARFQARASGRAFEWLQPHDQDAARDTLRQIIHQAVSQIAEKAEAHRQRAEVDGPAGGPQTGIRRD